jgi:hypothetical protein
LESAPTVPVARISRDANRAAHGFAFFTTLLPL